MIAKRLEIQNLEEQASRLSSLLQSSRDKDGEDASIPLRLSSTSVASFGEADRTGFPRDLKQQYQLASSPTVKERYSNAHCVLLFWLTGDFPQGPVWDLETCQFRAHLQSHVALAQQ